MNLKFVAEFLTKTDMAIIEYFLFNNRLFFPILEKGPSINYVLNRACLAVWTFDKPPLPPARGGMGATAPPPQIGRV